MLTRLQHTFAVGDYVVLLSGRAVRITKLRSTPGVDVNFEPVRSQPWYEGRDARKVTHIFPQSSIVQKYEDGYPKDVPNRPRRRRTVVRRVDDEKITYTLVWPNNGDSDSEELYRREGKNLAEALLHDAPAGITTEVFYSLLEFSLESPDLGVLPNNLLGPLKKFMQQLRAGQAEG